MDDPMFVMSMYVNKEALFEAKAKYYMEKSDRLQEEVYENHRIRRQRRAWIVRLEKELKRQRKLVADCMRMIDHAEIIVPFKFREEVRRKMPRAK